MKKFLALFVALVMLFCIVGCDKNVDVSSQISDDFSSSSQFTESQGSANADSTSSKGGGFWQNLFGGGDKNSSTSSQSQSQNGESQQENTSDISVPQSSVKPCKQGDEHSDENNDTVCDKCYISVIANIDFFSMNDLHGKFLDTDSQPGVDELTTYFKNAYRYESNVVLLSSGDMWQGSAESNLTKGNIITDWMNELDFVSMTLGNHEYDWGEQYIEDNANIAEFPFLAINIYERGTNKLADYCTPSTMIERGGAKIGIIGAIGDCYSSIASDFSGDVYFKTGSELTSLVKKESERLRSLGADFIIYSLHDGYGGTNYSETATDNMLASFYDVSLSNGYVDLVFEGHTHKHYVKKDRYGVYHLQNGGDNDGISHVEVNVNFANETFSVESAEFVSTNQYSNLEDDPVVDELAKKYDNEISKANEVLGFNSGYRSSDALREIIAQLYYEYGEKKWGREYDIVLGGGFLSARSPYNLKRGDVTYGDLQMIFPFDNPLVLCSVKGRDLKSKFFDTNNSNYFIYYGSYGEQVRRNIDNNKTYYIIVDSYTSTYAPNRLTEIQRYDSTTFARDLLAEYIKQGKLK